MRHVFNRSTAQVPVELGRRRGSVHCRSSFLHAGRRGSGRDFRLRSAEVPLSEVRHDLGSTVEPVARRMLYLAEPTPSVLGDSSEKPRVRGKVVGAVSHGSEQDLAGALASHAVVEALYEGRVASLERLVAFYVLFHAMAERVSRVSRFFFYLRFDTWRSQAGTRVATTPSPTSPAAAVDVATGLMDDVRRIESSAAFRDSMQRSRYGGSVLDFSGRGNRTARERHGPVVAPGVDGHVAPVADARRVGLLEPGPGPELGARGYRFRLPQSTSDPSPPHLAAQPSVVHEDGSNHGSNHTQDTKAAHQER